MKDQLHGFETIWRPPVDVEVTAWGHKEAPRHDTGRVLGFEKSWPAADPLAPARGVTLGAALGAALFLLFIAAIAGVLIFYRGVSLR